MQSPSITATTDTHPYANNDLTDVIDSYGITPDSSGDLWFTQFNDNEVGEYNPTTGTSADFASPTIDSGPYGIAVGEDGNVYYTEYGDAIDGSKIGVIDPSNGTIEDSSLTTLTADSVPYGIVNDPFGGDLWFTEYAGNNIGRIDPETGAVAEYPVPTAKSEPEYVTVDPSGNVWFTEFKADQIGTLNPNDPGNIQQYSVAGIPEGIVADSSGNIWVSVDKSGSFSLAEYNPSAHDDQSDQRHQGTRCVCAHSWARRRHLVRGFQRLYRHAHVEPNSCV